MNTAVLFQIQSVMILSLITFGIMKTKNRALHIRIMLSAITWDILLILQIELSRDAILKASQAATNTLWLNIHVSIAVLTVLFYFTLIYTGTRLKNGDNKIRNIHRTLGYTAYTLRILTFATSFMAVAK